MECLYKYSFWDSMIIAGAVEGGAGTILSEGFSDSYTVKGVTVEPLAKVSFCVIPNEVRNLSL